MDVPVLLINIASENDRSERGKLVKAICHTINMMRLFMNIFDSEVKVTEVSSIEVPKTGCNNNTSLRYFLRLNGAKVRIGGFKYNFFEI
jgi:hypothetical protein